LLVGRLKTPYQQPSPHGTQMVLGTSLCSPFSHVTPLNWGSCWGFISPGTGSLSKYFPTFRKIVQSWCSGRSSPKTRRIHANIFPKKALNLRHKKNSVRTSNSDLILEAGPNVRPCCRSLVHIVLCLNVQIFLKPFKWPDCKIAARNRKYKIRQGHLMKEFARY